VPLDAEASIIASASPSASESVVERIEREQAENTRNSGDARRELAALDALVDDGGVPALDAGGHSTVRIDAHRAGGCHGCRGEVGCLRSARALSPLLRSGLRRFNATLQGRVGVELLVAGDGTVVSKDVASDLPDVGVTRCVIHAMSKIVFPHRAGAGKASVTIVFRP
jgi:hypothetical protein